MRERLERIVLEAGMLLSEGYKKSKEITYKSAVDLVTQYDLQIELFLKKKLAASFEGYTLVGEETNEGITYPEKAIYIDPIDGTTNFVHGIPFVAISIGIWEAQKAVAGIVYNPILNELFYAQAGEGATLNGLPLRVTDTSELNKSLIATGFPYTKFEKGKDFEWVMQTMHSVLPHTRDMRRLGSAAIDLCYLARGTFDGFYELNLKPWDVAAGLLIVLEAGGKISKENGRGYTLDAPVIVATNGRIHEALISKMPAE